MRFDLKKSGIEEQSMIKISTRKEIVKIRADMKETKQRQIIETISNVKGYFFDKINRLVNTYLDSSQKKRKHKSAISEMKMQLSLQIIREYYE